MAEKAGPVRVLVAEDDAALRRLIDMLLVSQGYEVRAVGDGTEALTVIANWRPDAIVLDIMMPKLSGLTVCRELRSSPKNASIPIILLTAKSFDEDIESVMALGGITFMNKPFNPRQLMAALVEMAPPPAGAAPAPPPAKAATWLVPSKSELTTPTT